MGAVIFFVLIVIVLLSCTPRGERRLALGSMLVVGAVIWLAVRIKLQSILGALIGAAMGLAFEFRNELLLGFAAAIVLIVPMVMIYVAVSDQMIERAAAKARRLRRGIGFVLRSEHPWLWVDEGSNGRTTRSRKRSR